MKISKFTTGQIVKIYGDPHEESGYEGEARLISSLLVGDDLEYWNVRFVGSRGGDHKRWIKRPDQVVINPGGKVSVGEG